MSEVQAVGMPDVRVSIARAAKATGVDFDYLLAQAKLESRLDPNARAGTSSAAGLYQFIGSTWLETLDRHGARHGLGWADSAISSGKLGSSVSDPTMRSQIMALRYDPDAASLMAAELANDNRQDLRASLGREPDPAELYLAHFLGSSGAQRFLATLSQHPDSPAAGMFPKQAAANRSVFYDGTGAPRSFTEVMDFFRQRMSQAMAEEGNSVPLALPGMQLAAGTQPSGSPKLGPLAREFHATVSGYPVPGRVSMVETLRETFAGADSQPAMLPSNVKSAYSKLKAYGL